MSIMPNEPATPETDPFTPFDEHWDDPDDYDDGDACGRWDNGRLTRSCSMAGTEFCDFECPYRDTL